MGLFKWRGKFVTGVPLNAVKSVEGFDKTYLDKPLFKDLLACAGQISKTPIDLTKITSRRYLKRVVYGKATVEDKAIKQLFSAINVDINRLDENGYINSIIKELVDAVAVARKRGDIDAVPNCENALNASSLALARYVLDKYPDYKEQLDILAPALREL